MTDQNNHRTVLERGARSELLCFCRSLGTGIICSSIFLLLWILAAAWAVSKLSLPVTAVRGLAAGGVSAGGFLGSMTAGRLLQRKGLFLGLAAGICWAGIFLAGSCLFGTASEGLLTDLYSGIRIAGGLLCCPAGSLCGIALARHRRKRCPVC